MSLRRTGGGWKSPLGYFHSRFKAEHKSVHAALQERRLRPATSTHNTSAWPWCACSVSLDSGYGCVNQRWSSRRSCGCSSCRRSIWGSSSCCGCGWRCCSKRRRWWSGCWRKDWGGSKGWVAFWHCGEVKQRVHLILCRWINTAEWFSKTETRLQVVLWGGSGGLPCDSTRFQVTRWVSPPFLQRRVGFASPSLPALTWALCVCFSGAGRSPVS